MNQPQNVTETGVRKNSSLFIPSIHPHMWRGNPLHCQGLNPHVFLFITFAYIDRLKVFYTVTWIIKNAIITVRQSFFEWIRSPLARFSFLPSFYFVGVVVTKYQVNTVETPGNCTKRRSSPFRYILCIQILNRLIWHLFWDKKCIYIFTLYILF